jgi:endo-1,4-beta-xylanase
MGRASFADVSGRLRSGDQRASRSSRRRFALLLVVAALAGGCLRAPSVGAGLRFGYAVDPVPLATDPVYRAIVSADASVVTPENHMKWELIHPAPDRFDFTAADTIVAAAAAHDQTVRGHVLVWHRQLPSWLTDREWTRGQLVAVLRRHIHTVVGHFRRAHPGVVRQWDVVNEAFQADGTRRPTIWQEVIGDDYIELAFRFAHQADPDAELFYNDFFDNGYVVGEALQTGGPIGVGATAGRSSCDEVPKCVATRALAGDLVAKGVPIDGIGFQGHVLGTAPADYGELSEWTAPLGLDWALTEVDVALPANRGEDPAALAAQADAYVSMVGDCLGSVNCDTVVVWGVSDRDSWVPGATGGLFDHATLYDRDRHPKPAVARLLQLLSG